MSLSRVDTGTILDMNAAFLRILGFARGDVIGRTSAELDLWTSEDQRASLIAELRAKGRVEAREERMRRKDGSIATVLFSAVPALLSGEPHTITWVLDISARREAEEALRASEARWRSLVEQAPTLVLVADPAGIVRFVNKTVSGRPLESMIGRPIFDFLCPAAYREEARVRTSRGSSRSVTAAPFTHYLERVGGGRVWLDSLLAPVLRDGALDSVIIISDGRDAARRGRGGAAVLGGALAHSRHPDPCRHLAGGPRGHRALRQPLAHGPLTGEEITPAGGSTTSSGRRPRRSPA